MTSKKEILEDLRFCNQLMIRLIHYVDKNYMDSHSWASNHTVIQHDIIKLRRELNDVKKKLDWNYEDKR